MKVFIKYISLALLSISALYSCHNDSVVESKGDEPLLADGTPITLSITANLPGQGIATRNVQSIKNLYLVVFDKDHRYLYRAKAVLNQIVTSPPGIEYLPKEANEPVSNELYRFSVTLLSSNSPRIIHFISNYDWEGFKKDYELEGSDEGEIIPALYSRNSNQIIYWQSIKFNTIGKNSFHNKAFKLLRNEAKISLNNEDNEFTLSGFCINNAPDRGTVAPFHSKINMSDPSEEAYKDVLYNFPYKPVSPTILPNTALHKVGNEQNNKSSLTVFEYNNTEADADKKMAIIVYGKRKGGKRHGYYKIDIKKEVVDDDGNYIGSVPFNILRNWHFTITVNKVSTDGYPTYDEAVRNPAGNNIFASVELEDYPQVSDGDFMLSVDQPDIVRVSPGSFATTIRFAGPNLSSPATQHVNVFYNGKILAGAFTDDEYINDARFDKQTGTLTVNVKKIPVNEEKNYVFTVIGSSVDKQVHIQRTIRLKLHQKYNFNLELKEYNHSSNPQGERIDLIFTVPGTLPKTLFPYSVYIQADQLSPYVNKNDNIYDEMKVVKQDKKIYYEYIVKNPSSDGHDRRETIHFQRTTTNGKCTVTFISGYYNNGTVELK